MRPFLGVLIFAGLCVAQDHAEALARAVDVPTPAKRRRAARELAQRKDVTPAQWVEAARAFGTFAPVPAGRRKLRILDGLQVTVLVPKGYDPARAAPLLIASHTTSLPGPSAYGQWRGAAERLGMIVLCPWGRDPKRGYGFTEGERADTLAALRWARRRFHVDENRIYLAGYGRGGHLSWDLALRRRDRFAGMVAWDGGPCIVTSKGRNNLRYLENATDLPIRCLISEAGRKRRVIDNVQPAFDRLDEWGAPRAKLVVRDRGLFQAVDWDAFFKHTRDPRPRRVVRMYARKGEGRAFWVEVLQATARAQENFKLVATQAEAKTLDDRGYLRLMQRHADERTARLEVEYVGPGHFLAKGKYVRTFRLLLDESMLPKSGEVRITFNGKPYRREAAPSPAVLLTEFVERFDRTFLPVAEVRVP